MATEGRKGLQPLRNRQKREVVERYQKKGQEKVRPEGERGFLLLDSKGKRKSLPYTEQSERNWMRK